MSDERPPKSQISFGALIAPGVRQAVKRTDETLKLGVLHELEDGRPLPEGAELVEIEPRDEAGWHGCKTLYQAPRSGPAQVATDSYRAGHDRIFGRQQKVGLA